MRAIRRAGLHAYDGTKGRRMLVRSKSSLHIGSRHLRNHKVTHAFWGSALLSDDMKVIAKSEAILFE